MVTARWHLVGALLLLALGLAGLAFAVLGERRDSWRAGAFCGLMVVGLAVKWLRDLRARAIAK